MEDEIIHIDGAGYELDATARLSIISLEEECKHLMELRDKWRNRLLAEMEARGIAKLECDGLSVSYIAPIDRETFDKKRFKADHPELHDEYVTMKPVKASIRIKVG